MDYDVVVVGGGAAGFFAAINLKAKERSQKILILEKNKEVLQKVKISGGGRCNVTHACFDPKELTQFYPRGGRELLGPFHQFMTADTINWFEERGVALKIEDDGRMFPTSNKSQTIIDCFLNEIKKLKIDLAVSESLKSLRTSEHGWEIKTDKRTISTKAVVVATGSSKQMWNKIAELGHKIVPPVPSLFTFNIKDPLLKDLAGTSVKNTTVNIPVLKQSQEGPLLFTHWGLSGPGILKLSSYAARELYEINYQFELKVNFLNKPMEHVLNDLLEYKNQEGAKNIGNANPFELISKRLWHRFLDIAQIASKINWAALNKKQIRLLAELLTFYSFKVEGKSTFKDEFVTAGGVALNEVSFKTFESKRLRNLYFVGEVLNIDAVTGGFNFQNAWTSAYVLANNFQPKD